MFISFSFLLKLKNSRYRKMNGNVPVTRALDRIVLMLHIGFQLC